MSKIILCLPLLIHWLPAACGAGCWAGAAPNMSANGFPNCKRSSRAFVCCCGAAPWSAAPKRSTMLPDDAGGDERKGLLAFVGDPILDCEKIKKI